MVAKPLEAPMLPTVAQHRAENAALCCRFHARRLDLFRSAAKSDAFDPARSEVDLLVEYEPSHTPPALAGLLGLRATLEALLRYRVDFAMVSAIRNPYLRASIDAARPTAECRLIHAPAFCIRGRLRQRWPVSSPATVWKTAWRTRCCARRWSGDRA